MSFITGATTLLFRWLSWQIRCRIGRIAVQSVSWWRANPVLPRADTRRAHQEIALVHHGAEGRTRRTSGVRHCSRRSSAAILEATITEIDPDAVRVACLAFTGPAVDA